MLPQGLWRRQGQISSGGKVTQQLQACVMLAAGVPHRSSCLTGHRLLPCHVPSLQDYKPPPYVIDTVHLTFLLNEDVTRVESRLHILPKQTDEQRPPLFLNGRSGAECNHAGCGGVHGRSV